MALVKGADTHHMAETISPVGQNGFRWGCNGLYWGRFRPDSKIDKMVPRRVKSAPGAIELNQHFGAETDLLDLECMDQSTVA